MVTEGEPLQAPSRWDFRRTADTMLAWIGCLAVSRGTGSAEEVSMTGSERGTCLCGHERVAHEHYRRGSECALCPAGGCWRFRTVPGLLTRLRRHFD